MNAISIKSLINHNKQMSTLSQRKKVVMSITICYKCKGSNVEKIDNHRSWCKDCKQWIHDKELCQGCTCVTKEYDWQNKECGIENRCMPADYAYYTSYCNCLNCGNNKKNKCYVKIPGRVLGLPTKMWGRYTCTLWNSINKINVPPTSIAPPVAFNLTDYKIELHESKGWNLYMDTEGILYKTNRRTDTSATNSHTAFASEYLNNACKINVDKSIQDLQLSESLQGSKDYLIHILGWVSFGYFTVTQGVYIQAPNPKYYGKSITRRQSEILLSLFEINGDDLTVYYRDLFPTHYDY